MIQLYYIEPYEIALFFFKWLNVSNFIWLNLIIKFSWFAQIINSKTKYQVMSYLKINH